MSENEKGYRSDDRTMVLVPLGTVLKLRILDAASDAAELYIDDLTTAIYNLIADAKRYCDADDELRISIISARTMIARRSKPNRMPLSDLPGSLEPKSTKEKTG